LKKIEVFGTCRGEECSWGKKTFKKKLGGVYEADYSITRVSRKVKIKFIETNDPNRPKLRATTDIKFAGSSPWRRKIEKFIKE
jgi:hypothetical protein